MKGLATSITVLRFALGLVGLWYLFFGEFVALILIFVAILLDALDGYVARKFDDVTPLGKTLDNLVDGVIGWGVVCVQLVIGRIPLSLLYVIVPTALFAVGSTALSMKKHGHFESSKHKHWIGGLYYVCILTVLLATPWSIFVAWIGFVGLLLGSLIALRERAQHSL